MTVAAEPLMKWHYEASQSRLPQRCRGVVHGDAQRHSSNVIAQSFEIDHGPPGGVGAVGHDLGAMVEAFGAHDGSMGGDIDEFHVSVRVQPR